MTTMTSKLLSASIQPTAPSSVGSTGNENYLSLEELMRYLKQVRSSGNAVSIVDGAEEANWKDRGLSGWACYEIIYGALLDRTGQTSGPLLEALCFFVEQTLNSSAPHVVKNGLHFFRPLEPALHQLLHARDSSGWAARMLAAVHVKEGILTDDTVHELQRALDENEELAVLDSSRPHIIEALKVLQPLRPDLITQDVSENSRGTQFPTYSPCFQKRKASQTTTKEDFGQLPPRKTFHTKYPTALSQPHKTRRWFTGDALADADNFISLWTKLRFPDQLLCLLTDANLLTAYWLSARPSKSATTMERRILDMVQDLLVNEGRGKSSEERDVSQDEGTTEEDAESHTNITDLLEFVTTHIHETLPAVSSMAMDSLGDLESSTEDFLKAVHQVSLIHMSGNGLEVVQQAFSVIAGRFAEGSEADQMSILQALRTILRDWQRDLPRLWDLESEVCDDDKLTLAKQSFMHSEVGIQAAYVDTVVTFRMLVDLIDRIVWKPAMDSPVSDEISTRYWNEIIQLWKQVIEVIEMGENAQVRASVSRYLPHPQLMLVGSLQPSRFIREEMKALLDRCWTLSEPSDKKEQLRMRELFKLFGRKRSNPVRRK